MIAATHSAEATFHILFSAPPEMATSNPFDFSPRAVEGRRPKSEAREKTPTREFFRGFSLRRKTSKQKSEPEPAVYDPNGSGAAATHSVLCGVTVCGGGGALLLPAAELMDIRRRLTCANRVR